MFSVPCTRQTGRETLEEEEYPTVLAEFSSVVADTQHYLIPEEGEMQDDTLSQVSIYRLQASERERGFQMGSFSMTLTDCYSNYPKGFFSNLLMI